MTNKKIGLCLGKYAPLHKGHQFVIETALSEMDHVIILIYNCPETIRCPLNVRSQWLQKLYPSAEVVEAWDGPTEVGNSSEIKRVNEQYILSRLSGRKITHFYSSEFYGDHVSKALGAINRQVDNQRTKFPISATQIRCNFYAYRQYLEPLVYRDFITNVVFLGAPSTGKTTVAERLAKKYQTVWMPEYGREYWEKNQIERRLSLEQLVEIAQGHLSREEQLLSEANKYLFTDTNAITTYMFSRYYHGKAHERLRELACSATSRYDLVFVCDTDIPYADTWDRSGEINCRIFQEQIISDLILRKVPYLLLRGTLESRMERVCKMLDSFEKYSNLLDCLDQQDE